MRNAGWTDFVSRGLRARPRGQGASRRPSAGSGRVLSGRTLDPIRRGTEGVGPREPPRQLTAACLDLGPRHPGDPPGDLVPDELTRVDPFGDAELFHPGRVV